VTVQSLKEALATALVVITLLLLALWRRISDTLLVMLPLLLAGALTVATVYLAGLSFNFANVIVLPLLLGIGVDSGIHLVHRARTAGARGADLLSETTARAVFYSALTTIASFGSLALSSHRGVASLGLLLVIGITYTLVANLIVLPALLSVVHPAEEASRKGVAQSGRARSLHDF
jgi:predicted RND superfamily exporter protein